MGVIMTLCQVVPRAAGGHEDGPAWTYEPQETQEAHAALNPSCPIYIFSVKQIPKSNFLTLIWFQRSKKQFFETLACKYKMLPISHIHLIQPSPSYKAQHITTQALHLR